MKLFCKIATSLMAASLLAAPLFAATLAAQPEPGAAVEYADQAARKRGDLSQLAVLATAHLVALPKGFDPDRFDALIDRLAAWQPDRIATEEVSGWDCERLRRYDFQNEGSAKSYCVDTAPFLTSLGLDLPGAEQAIEAILVEPAAERPPETRRRLAALFLAAGEDTSALVQWLRLPENQRAADDVLTPAMVEFLNARQNRMSEVSVIAAPLAARLGHERVYPVDDQRSVRWGAEMDRKTYGEQMMAIWKSPALDERLAREEAEREAFVAGGTAIDWYRSMNSPEWQRASVQTDFGAAAGSREYSATGRSYLAYWERRNMLMVANLREVLGSGRRVLAIVGASHKAYYERYMGISSDVEIVDIAELLGPAA